MGDTATKLHNYAHFREQITEQRDQLVTLEPLRIWDLTENTMEEVLGRVGDMLDRMRISKSDSHLVATTKVLHHVLPDLIPPIDRNYTLRYFGLSTMLPSQKAARSIFLELFPLFAHVARTIPDPIQAHVRLGEENWHTSFTKVIDSAIIGALIQQNGSVDSERNGDKKEDGPIAAQAAPEEPREGDRVFANSFSLVLQPTYARTGFFNVGVEYEKLLGGDGEKIEIFCGNAEKPILGAINRRANNNGTPRIMGGAGLRRWFEHNASVMQTITVLVSSPTMIRLVAEEG